MRCLAWFGGRFFNMFDWWSSGCPSHRHKYPWRYVGSE